jgi:hypothetical protein
MVFIEWPCLYTFFIYIYSAARLKLVIYCRSGRFGKLFVDKTLRPMVSTFVLHRSYVRICCCVLGKRIEDGIVLSKKMCVHGPNATVRLGCRHLLVVVVSTYCRSSSSKENLRMLRLLLTPMIARDLTGNDSILFRI